MTTITPLPTPAPSRDQTQSAFNSAANALFGALPTMVTQINTVAGEVNAAAGAASTSASAASTSASQATANGAAQVAIAQDWAIKTTGPVSGGEYSAKYHAQAAAASAATAINAPGTSATSTTSLTVGTGSKSLTIQAGKLFAVGQFVVIASTASPSNYMAGQITAHDNVTGALTVNVGATGGSGTLAAWTVAPGADSNALLRSGGTMTGALNEAKAADVASAATLNLSTATGNYVTVTGTTTITAITLAAGAARTVRFAGALTLTHGASLVLPGATNITTAAGDAAVFVGDSGGVVRCTSYQRASGLPVVSGGASAGDVVLSATVKTPPDYLAADGSIYLKSSYPALSALLGSLRATPAALAFSAQTSGTANNLLCVAFGAGVFVAVGASGTCLTSPDGVTWTSRTVGLGTNTVEVVRFVGGRFYALSQASSTIATSTDGITWGTASGGFVGMRDVAYDGTAWVIVGGTGSVRRSLTGTSFNTISTGSGVVFSHVSAGGGRFVALGTSSGSLASMVSTDGGATWSGGGSTLGAPLSGAAGLVYHNGYHIAFCAITTGDPNVVIMKTVDGDSWVGSVGRHENLASAAWATVGDGWVVSPAPFGSTCRSLMFTRDGDGAELVDLGNTSGAFYAAAYGGGAWVAVGASGAIRSANAYGYDAATQFRTPYVTVPPGVAAYIKT